NLTKWKQWKHDNDSSLRPMRTSVARMGRARQKQVPSLGKAGDEHRPRGLERLREAGFQEFAQLGCRPELRDGVQFLECRRERVGETPDGSRPEFLVLWLEVKVMHAAGEVLWGF